MGRRVPARARRRERRLAALPVDHRARRDLDCGRATARSLAVVDRSSGGRGGARGSAVLGAVRARPCHLQIQLVVTALHAALDRVYKLAVSLPDAPLARFRAQTAGLPQTTEAERLVVQHIGQEIFRAAPMTIGEPAARSPASPILSCCGPPTSSRGPNATTRNGSMCTTACSSPRSGMRPSMHASPASLMTAPSSPALD